jgi:hypothetical protein
MNTITIILIVIIAYVVITRWTEGFDEARAQHITETYKSAEVPPFREYNKKTGGSTVEYHDIKLLKNQNKFDIDNVRKHID